MLVEACWHMMPANFIAVGPDARFRDSQSQYSPPGPPPDIDDDDVGGEARHLEPW
jgi:hypothetical protein